MSKLLLLYVTFIFGLIFLLVPMKNNMVDFFPFSDFQIYPVNHVYYICEKLTMIVLAYVIYNEATKYRGAIHIFFLLLCADLVDYLLCYGAVWGYVNGFPISFNVIKCLIFGLTILYVWVRPYFK